MKFSLHERLCSSMYLEKADEIVVEYRDRNAIIDFAKKFPNAQFMLEILPNTSWEFKEIKEAYILSKHKLIICVPDINDPKLQLLKENNIPYFWGYTVTTFWELQALIKSGVSQVRIGAPLFFECDKLKKFNIIKRITANLAHGGYLPFVDGITGTWIRPEDVEQYEDTFNIIEFTDCRDNKEEALYRIYAEQKQWPGRVDMIISNINTNAYNRMITKEFAQARKNCRQRCESEGTCHLCHRMLSLADRDKLQNYIKEIAETTEHS